MRLAEMFQRYARGAGVKIAEQFAKELRQVVGVQAQTRVTRSGKLVATTRAVNQAPPRRVSGKLQRSIKVIRTSTGNASVQIYAEYAWYLEKRTGGSFPHKFVKIALQNLGLTGRNS